MKMEEEEEEGDRMVVGDIEIQLTQDKEKKEFIMNLNENSNENDGIIAINDGNKEEIQVAEKEVVVAEEKKQKAKKSKLKKEEKLAAVLPGREKLRKFPNVPRKSLDKLVEMGFAIDKAAASLKKCKNNEQLALENLIDSISLSQVSSVY